MAAGQAVEATSTSTIGVTLAAWRGSVPGTAAQMIDMPDFFARALRGARKLVD